MKQTIYAFCGLGARADEFDLLKKNLVPITLKVIEYPEPKENESLDSFVKRIDGLLPLDASVFIGVSLGGIIAQKIALKRKGKAIVISSIVSGDEVPWYFKKADTYNLAKKIQIKDVYAFLLKTSTIRLPKVYASLYKLVVSRVSNMTNAFVHWTIKTIATYPKTKKTPSILRVHGIHDAVFPVSLCEYFPGIILLPGTHFLIHEKPKEIAFLIQSFLSKNK